MFSTAILSQLTEDLRESQALVDVLEQQLAAARAEVGEWSRLIQLAELNSDPEPAGELAAGDTVPIGGVAKGALVSCPGWNDGRPVKIHDIEDSERWTSNTFVVYRDADATDGPFEYVHVPQDMQVTPCLPAPAAGAWFVGTPYAPAYTKLGAQT